MEKMELSEALKANASVLYLRVFSEIMYTYMYEASKELSRRRLYFS